MFRPAVLACLSLGLLARPVRADSLDELMTAASKGDVKAVEALLARGGDVNRQTPYGASALWFAAYKGRTEVVKVLLKHKADVNVRDGVWGETPLSLSLVDDRADMAKLLLEAGAVSAGSALMSAAEQKQAKVVAAVLATGKVKGEVLDAALFVAPAEAGKVIALLKKAGAKPLAAAAAAAARRFAPYPGAYESLGGGRCQVTVRAGILVVRPGYGETCLVKPDSPGPPFAPLGHAAVTVTFDRAEPKAAWVSIRRGTVESRYERAAPSATPERRPGAAAEDDAPVVAPGNWPSFRGPRASGVADGQHPPVAWDAGKQVNVRWRAPLPGLGHSSPVVWGDRVFVTTAARDGAAEFKPGLYGAGTSAKEDVKHRWLVYCLDKRTGKVLWERTAHEGIPKVKRHIKSSHANPTPATNGRRLVVSFASEGLYCYDLDGKLCWKQDLGVVDAGAFNEPGLQWGAASSPVIVRDRVVVQCDRHKDSFLAAYDLETGKPVWRTLRDEGPSWGTPTFYEGPRRAELITNGSRFVRGYDPQAGKELWRLSPNSEITVPTPVVGHGLIFVTSGYRPVQPIYAVWPGAAGDISLKAGADASPAVAWSKRRGGPYMPTPIVYGNHLYTCSNNGTVSCFEARTGALVYQRRLGGTGGYSASPVAADGRLYFTGEEGEVRVVKAGPAFELLAVNPMGDYCMATPAVADGMIFVRTQHALFGLGRGPARKVQAPS